METSGWVSVRCVFRAGDGGEQLYEERITLWHTDDLNEAIARAESEADDYARTVGYEYVGLAQAYLLADEPGEGAEVFSLMRGSELDPEGYLDTYFDTGRERGQEWREDDGD